MVLIPGSAPAGRFRRGGNVKFLGVLQCPVVIVILEIEAVKGFFNRFHFLDA